MEKSPREMMNFVIWEENQERLLAAKKLGLDKGPVINEIVRIYFNDYLKHKSEELKETAMKRAEQLVEAAA
ncbi:MAG TPA: hypothetical protein VIK59_05005 [Verrucomicrobiae bacterium]